MALWSTARHIHLLADFADMNVYSAAIDCTDTPQGLETIDLLGKSISTLKVDEDCRSDQLDWSFRNLFWVSPSSGMVWKSVQHIHPDLGAIEVSVLRPVAAP